MGRLLCEVGGAARGGSASPPATETEARAHRRALTGDTRGDECDAETLLRVKMGCCW